MLVCQRKGFCMVIVADAGFWGMLVDPSALTRLAGFRQGPPPSLRNWIRVPELGI